AVSTATGIGNRTLTNGLLVQSAWGWDPGASSFNPTPLNQSLPAGTILWIYASDNGILPLMGAYSEPAPVAVTAPAQFLAAPGQAFYIQAPSPSQLRPPEPTLQIRYYHEDHLGSDTVMTDATGALVEETAFYPFGYPRNDFQPRNLREEYQFAQKEHDAESSL